MASSSNPSPTPHQAPTTENSDFDSSCSLYEEHNQQLVAKNRKDIVKEQELTAKGKKRKTTVGKKKQDTSKPGVWPHFTKYNEPLVEVVDGVEKVVGSTQRCSCNYCGTTLGCDSRGRILMRMRPKMSGMRNVKKQNMFWLHHGLEHQRRGLGDRKLQIGQMQKYL